MAKIISISAPNPKQARFFEARQRFIGYGGARGGGKSWATRIKAVLLALKYPKLRILIMRKTYPELLENHLQPLSELLAGVSKFNKSDKVFIFPNGSRIKLGYCNYESDIYQYQGQEYDAIFLDECTHFSWSQVAFLMTCNRNTRTDFSPRMYFMGNPGGVGHNWFKRLFVKPAYKPTERPEDYLYIPATVDDNTVLMETNPEYVSVLDNLPEKLREAHRYGNWDIFEGQFFEDFIDDAKHYADRRNTHVIEPFEIPTAWQIYRSFDFGYAKPFSCAWWAVDYDGRLYRILELYGCTKEPNTGVKWEPNKIFAEIRRIEQEHRWLKGKQIFGIADPSIWDASRGESVNDAAVRNGVYFSPGDNKRIPGWMQVHYRLAFDDNGLPMMYIFNTCAGFIRTLPELQYSDNKPEDLDTDGEDHIADEVRYMCMARPIAPRVSVDKQVISDDPLELTDKRYKSYNSI